MKREAIARHLGIPAGEPFDSVTDALVSEAIDWYRSSGEPWSAVTMLPLQRIDADRIELEGDTCLSSERVASAFREANVHAVAIVAATAGPSVDREIQRRWKDDKPDEAMILNAVAIAEVELLRDESTARVAERLAPEGVSVLDRLGPGYDGWSLADMAALVRALGDRGPIEVLESGGLLPQKSTVVVLGLTRKREASGTRPNRQLDSRPSAAPSALKYAYPEKALEKWGAQRLTMTDTGDGRLAARFRFEGKTCASLNRPFTLDYEVELDGVEPSHARIISCRVKRVSGDSGLRWTCAFREGPEAFISSMEEPPALVGETLGVALAWEPDESPAACLCTAANRNHKWKIVLQTLHHALNQSAQAKALA